jgi:hypothetical protein
MKTLTPKLIALIAVLLGTTMACSFQRIYWPGDLFSQPPAEVVPFTNEATAQPTSTAAVSAPSATDGGIYNILLSYNMASCCEECNFGAFNDYLSMTLSGYGIPVDGAVQIRDDNNTIERIDSNNQVISIHPVSQHSIEDLIDLSGGFSKNITTADGANFRTELAKEGISISDYAHMIGVNPELLEEATRIKFYNAPSGNETPHINITAPDNTVTIVELDLIPYLDAMRAAGIGIRY